MFVFLISQILCAWFAFFLPCYSTFKAISHQPISQPELQRWTIYWIVLGAFLTFEHLAEWLISWFPFYWETKTIFLLFLSLPQTEGSTYIYNVYLQPFLIKNEADLDAGIVAVQKSTFIFIQTRLSNLWEFIWSLLNKTPASSQASSSSLNNTQQQSAAPSLSLDSVMGLWRSYGPAVISALQPSSKPPTASDGMHTPGSQSFASASSSSIQTPSGADRRIPQSGSDPSLPNPYASTASTPSDPPPFPEPQFH